jgi:hypothetical protein
MTNHLKIAFLSFLISIPAFANKGTYEVPTSNRALKPNAFFEMNDVNLKISQAGQIEVSYTIPTELTGLENKLSFSGEISNGTATMNSEYGQMTCLATASKMMCSVSYQKLQFDTLLAEQNMSQKFSGAELVSRLEIQTKFSTDPIGLLHIQLSRKLKKTLGLNQ